MQQIMEKMKSLLKINKYNIEKRFQYMLDAGAISYSYFVIFNVTQAIKDKSLNFDLVNLYIYLYLNMCADQKSLDWAELEEAEASPGVRVGEDHEVAGVGVHAQPLAPVIAALAPVEVLII